jgi:hypothetical protein
MEELQEEAAVEIYRYRSAVHEGSRALFGVRRRLQLDDPVKTLMRSSPRLGGQLLAQGFRQAREVSAVVKGSTTEHLSSLDLTSLDLTMCFEGGCREALPRLYAREGVTSAFEVGEYWDRNCQIDVVGLRQEGWTDLGECRWGAVRGRRPLRQELEAKVRQYPNRRNATICRRIFTRLPVSGDQPPSDEPEVRWHDLEDLYR